MPLCTPSPITKTYEIAFSDSLFIACPLMSDYLSQYVHYISASYFPPHTRPPPIHDHVAHQRVLPGS